MCLVQQEPALKHGNKTQKPKHPQAGSRQKQKGKKQKLVLKSEKEKEREKKNINENNHTVIMLMTLLECYRQGGNEHEMYV